MWSLWPCVQTTATTRRPATPSTIGAASCAASITRHSVSSPTIQMLLSTSKSSPSIENVPWVTTRSRRVAPLTAPPPSRLVRSGASAAARVETLPRGSPSAALRPRGRCEGSQDHHGTEDVALLHLVEGVLHRVERDGLAHEFLERQPSLE